MSKSMSYKQASLSYGSFGSKRTKEQIIKVAEEKKTARKQPENSLHFDVFQPVLVSRSFVCQHFSFFKLGSEVTLKQFVLFLQTRPSPRPRYS